eukprot:7274501-Alexandrium_andersonii.AAC.1
MLLGVLCCSRLQSARLLLLFWPPAFASCWHGRMLSSGDQIRHGRKSACHDDWCGLGRLRAPSGDLQGRGRRC